MPFVINATAVVPVIPGSAVSPDGLIRATTVGSGILLRADFSVSLNGGIDVPRHLRFYRSNGTTLSRVRSGDPASAPGGVALAYDDEAPLGVISIWYAEPLDSAADNEPQRLRSQGVSLLLTEPLGGVLDPGTWIKSLEDPAKSMQVKIASWPEVSYTSRASVNVVLGRRNPAVVADVRSGASSQLQVLTTSAAEREAFRDLVESGQVMLTQSKQSHGRPDRYWLFGDITESRPATLSDAPHRLWTAVVTEIDRPDTSRQPMRLAGRSFADRLADYPTFADATRTGRTFEQAITG